MSKDIAARGDRAGKKSLGYHNIDAAEMRRRQLLATACDLVETEGVEALKPARIGELSGCARTLVYRYFPDRDAILRAITDEFYKKLAERLPVANADQIATAGDEGVMVWVGEVVDAFFDTAAETSVAAILLRGTPPISAEYATFLDGIYKWYDMPWSRALRAFGIAPAEMRILVDSAYAVIGSTMRAIPKQQLCENRGRTLATVAVAALLQKWLDHHTGTGNAGSNVTELPRPD